jgi:type IV pilus assembly protein PilW
MRRRHAGFTMIEILVALMIGLFLLFGLSGVMQTTKRTFTSQNLLSQLQDSERLAATMMNDVIEQAGYFPNPTLNTATTSFGAAAPFSAGQSIYGVYSTGTAGDSISVRYTAAALSTFPINCTGGSNSAGTSNTTYTNTFSVVVTNNVSQLVCTLNGVTTPLINNVTNLKVLYGVNTSGSGNNVDTYMNASQVTNWSNVMSVKITLTFANPLFGAPGQPSGGTATYLLTRTINIMQQTG